MVKSKRKELVLREPTMAYGCVTDNGNYLLMLSFRTDHRVQTGVYLDGKTGHLIRPVYDVFKEFAYASNFRGEKIRKLSHEEFLEKYNPLSFKERIFLHYNMLGLRLLYQKDGSFKLAIPSEKFIISYTPTQETIKYFIILYHRKQKYKKKMIREGKYVEPAPRKKESSVTNSKNASSSNKSGSSSGKNASSHSKYNSSSNKYTSSGGKYNSSTSGSNAKFQSNKISSSVSPKGVHFVSSSSGQLKSDIVPSVSVKDGGVISDISSSVSSDKVSLDTVSSATVSTDKVLTDKVSTDNVSSDTTSSRPKRPRIKRSVP
jgi:hypothetical protein